MKRTKLLNDHFQLLKLLIWLEKKLNKLPAFNKINRTASFPEVSMVLFNTYAINKYIKWVWNTMDTN